MIIKVTQAHIDAGCRGQGDCCPVSLAVKEVVNDPCPVASVAYIALRNHMIPTPTTAAYFISNYDAHGAAYPFEFDLDIPAEYLC